MNHLITDRPVVAQRKPEHERNRQAQAEWRALCRTDPHVDVALELSVWVKRWYPLRPEPFIDALPVKLRKAFGFLRGDVGRLRVLSGEPLELRTVPITEIFQESLATGRMGRFGTETARESLRTDTLLQFEQSQVKQAFDALHAAVRAPFWGVVERGTLGVNHIAFLVKSGTTKVGACNGIVTDRHLIRTLVYLAKPPIWSTENPKDTENPEYPGVAHGYVIVKRAREGAAVAQRYAHRGLPPQRIRPVSLHEIETALGYPLMPSSVLSDQELLHYVPPLPLQKAG